MNPWHWLPPCPCCTRPAPPAPWPCPCHSRWTHCPSTRKTMEVPVTRTSGGRHSKSRIVCAVLILLLKTLCGKMAKKSLNMTINWVKMDKKFRNINKIMNFPACTYKSENVAQSQQKIAPSHDGETVTFRNSVWGRVISAFSPGHYSHLLAKSQS